MYGLNFLFVKIDLLISIQNEDTQTNNNESTMNQQTIGCNLCYKAGCSENIYSSHWTIYCPSLLTQPCKFCKEDLQWCDCPRQCEKGSHDIDNSTLSCRRCRKSSELIRIEQK